MTDMDVGECILMHYERFLREPMGRAVFESQAFDFSLQVLEYNNVFEQCRVFASFGLSHFARQLGGAIEVVVPVDQGWEIMASVLANVLFRMVELEMQVGVGTRVSGIEKVFPGFASAFGKSAFYLTDPYDFPPPFAAPHCEMQDVRIYLGVFITDAEFEIINRNGINFLEEMFESQKIDPYVLRRNCATV